MTGTCTAEPAGAAAVADKPAAAAPGEAKPAGVRVAYSLVIWDREMEAVVKAAGIEGHTVVKGPGLGTWHDIKGRKTLRPGAFDGLERGDCDTLLVATPSCYPSKETWAGQLGPDSTPALICDAGVKNNPKFRLVWQTWFWAVPDRKDAKKLNMPLDNPGVVERLRGLEQLVDEINQKHGRQVMVVSPAAQATIAFVRMVDAGTFPGITDPATLWNDVSMWQPGSHVRSLVQYCNLATMYGMSPIGLEPDFSAITFGGGKTPKGSFKDLAPITDEQREILQRLAWETVTGFPASGVKKP
jgi:hypothetical protein